jgi:hypothetical protein
MIIRIATMARMDEKPDRSQDRRILAIKVALVLAAYWAIVPVASLVWRKQFDFAAMLWYGLFATGGILIVFAMQPLTRKKPKLAFFLSIGLLLALVVVLTPWLLD